MCWCCSFLRCAHKTRTRFEKTKNVMNRDSAHAPRHNTNRYTGHELVQPSLLGWIKPHGRPLMSTTSFVILVCVSDRGGLQGASSGPAKPAARETILREAWTTERRTGVCTLAGRHGMAMSSGLNWRCEGHEQLGWQKNRSRHMEWKAQER